MFENFLPNEMEYRQCIVFLTPFISFIQWFSKKRLVSVWIQWIVFLTTCCLNEVTVYLLVNKIMKNGPLFVCTVLKCFFQMIKRKWHEAKWDSLIFTETLRGLLTKMDFLHFVVKNFFFPWEAFSAHGGENAIILHFPSRYFRTALSLLLCHT